MSDLLLEENPKLPLYCHHENRDAGINDGTRDGSGSNGVNEN
ncbi:hypothetical protein [Pseudomonas sp. RW10S2]|nr:hypothetical protein [Pseudomonas sp. RW10S2]